MSEYQYLIIPIITLVIAQIIKFIIESLAEKKLKWGRLFNGSGGMPSAHSSFAFSLTFTIGINQGYNSILFAIALVFSMIVAYDAMGLRKESGLHAESINKISEEIFSANYKEGLKHLKEELGHNPEEVLAGILLAIITSSIFSYLIF